jgi:hypothetical protein
LGNTCNNRKRWIILKKQSKRRNQDDIEALKSINDAWKEIESGKGGKSITSKFFSEFVKW